MMMCGSLFVLLFVVVVFGRERTNASRITMISTTKCVNHSALYIAQFGIFNVFVDFRISFNNFYSKQNASNSNLAPIGGYCTLAILHKHHNKPSDLFDY